MVAINKGRQRNRVSYDILNNLSSVDLFYHKKMFLKIFKKLKGACSFMYEQNDTNGSFFASYKTFTSPDAGRVQPRNIPFFTMLGGLLFYHRKFIFMDLDRW
jgi:hypothetical protein